MQEAPSDHVNEEIVKLSLVQDLFDQSLGDRDNIAKNYNEMPEEKNF
ncbi:MAG: hypothetical protein HWD61_07695 [Parachlamydiaceae bacterium]|nr:MAG: hypothetical protein HWD61_07695 [Parachlamydiaceae bacterium]